MRGVPIPNVPWDVIPVEVRGTGVTILLARVWLDVLESQDVDREWVRSALVSAVAENPERAMLAAHVTRPPHVRAMEPASQARWLVHEISALSPH